MTVSSIPLYSVSPHRLSSANFRVSYSLCVTAITVEYCVLHCVQNAVMTGVLDCIVRMEERMTTTDVLSATVLDLARSD